MIYLFFLSQMLSANEWVQHWCKGACSIKTSINEEQSQTCLYRVMRQKLFLTKQPMTDSWEFAKINESHTVSDKVLWSTATKTEICGQNIQQGMWRKPGGEYHLISFISFLPLLFKRLFYLYVILSVMSGFLINNIYTFTKNVPCFLSIDNKKTLFVQYV